MTNLATLFLGCFVVGVGALARTEGAPGIRHFFDPEWIARGPVKYLGGSGYFGLKVVVRAMIAVGLIGFVMATTL